MTEAFCEEISETRVCEKHGEYKSRQWHIPLLKKNAIRWTGCIECDKEDREKREAEDARVDAESRQRRIEEKISKAGIPIRFRARNFTNFIADTDAKKKAFDVARKFASEFKEHQKSGTTVIFSGLPGTGKTHLAISIADIVLQSGTAIYTSAIDAIRAIRDTWRRNSEKTEIEVLNLLAGVDLLILDEVGVQFGTEAEQVHLFDIIDKRYRDMMPTIILTNLGTKGLRDFLGDRSYDRLREGGIWVKFEWESHRGKK